MGQQSAFMTCMPLYGNPNQFSSRTDSFLAALASWPDTEALQACSYCHSMSKTDRNNCCDHCGGPRE